MVVIITLNKTKPPKEKVGGFPVKRKRRLRIKTKFPEDNRQKRIQSRPLSVSSYSEYLACYRFVPLANHRPTHSKCDGCRDAVDTVKPLSSGTMQFGVMQHNVPETGSTVRRRLSAVLARKLSSTIGWRASGIPVHDIVTEGKTLCGQYIKFRLVRSGVYNRKSVPQRLHSLTIIRADDIMCEVLEQLLSIGLKLERMYPLLYVGVARQVGGGVLITDKSVNYVITAVGKKLFRTDITWGKIVSLFAVAGGLAVDCVRQGHPEYLQCIINSIGEVLEYEVAYWIDVNDGWSGLLTYCKPPTNEISVVGFAALLSAVMASVLLLVLLLRWFGKLLSA